MIPERQQQAQRITPEQVKSFARIYEGWDRALSASDVDGLLAFYAPDATLESPLVPHLMGTDRGVLRGREELRPFFEKLRQRKPKMRQYYRTGFLTDGGTMMWEYPRKAEQGEQMDFVEVMEVRDGLIQHHRVYWGWYGVNVIMEDRYR